MASEVTIRELRHQGGRVLERVERGETLTVTRDGHPVAELRPIPERALTAEALLRRWRGLPAVDLPAFRRDIDSVIEPSL